MKQWWKEKDYIGIKVHEKYFNGLWFLNNDDSSYALPLGFDMGNIVEEYISEYGVQ